MVSSVRASLERLCSSLSWADTGAYDTWYGCANFLHSNTIHIIHSTSLVNGRPKGTTLCEDCTLQNLQIKWSIKWSHSVSSKMRSIYLTSNPTKKLLFSCQLSWPKWTLTYEIPGNTDPCAGLSSCKNRSVPFTGRHDQKRWLNQGFVV